MANVLLGMPRRNLHMDSQIFPPANDTKFSFSDVPYVMETPFDMF
jgi:hypothetical protein